MKVQLDKWEEEIELLRKELGMSAKYWKGESPWSSDWVPSPKATADFMWRFHAKNKTSKFDISDDQTLAFLNKEKKSYMRDQTILGYPALPKGSVTSFKVKYTYD